jgi:hypothetical protein
MENDVKNKIFYKVKDNVRNNVWIVNSDILVYVWDNVELNIRVSIADLVFRVWDSVAIMQRYRHFGEND